VDLLEIKREYLDLEVNLLNLPIGARGSLHRSDSVLLLPNPLLKLVEVGSVEILGPVHVLLQ